MKIKRFNENIIDDLNIKPISKNIGDFILEISKTPNSYKISVKHNNKTIGRLYLMNIKKKSDGYWGEARRFYISKEYRNKGIDKIIVNTVKEYFRDINIYAYPSPNRFKDLTDDNREDYRNKLSRLYSMYGMKKVGNKSRMEIKRFNEMMEDKYDYDLIIKDLKGRGWGFGIISSIDDFEENDLYFTNPNSNDEYANQFHVYLTDLQTGQLRGRFNNKQSLRLGTWQHGINVNKPISIYNQRT